MSLEIIRKAKSTAALKTAIFDFDGTLSLIREGWQEILTQYCLEVLEQTPNHESTDEMAVCVRRFIDLQTGKSTIYQCIQLAEETAKRGGKPLDPNEYLAEYLLRLDRKTESRIRELQSDSTPDRHLVPGSHKILRMLQSRGVTLCLLSGTEEEAVRREAELLQLAPFFDGGIYGAPVDAVRFSKAGIMQTIMQERNLSGEELVGFGDGHVETENIYHLGGLAVGVALNENTRIGIDPKKREMLIKAGADWIIPDFSDTTAIEAGLF